MDDEMEQEGGRPGSATEVGRRFDAAIRLFPTKREAANTLHISTDQLSRYIKGDASPPLAVLIELAGAKKISLDWLATGEGPMLRSTPVGTVLPLESGAKGVPIYDAVLSLGNGRINSDDAKPIGILDLPADYLRDVLHCAPENAIAVYMDGSSMTPTLRDHDLAIVDMSVKTLIGDDVYAFSLDGEGYIKRLQRAGAAVIVHSDNDSYSDWTITKDQLDAFHIIGRVAGAIQRV